MCACVCVNCLNRCYQQDTHYTHISTFTSVHLSSCLSVWLPASSSFSPLHFVAHFVSLLPQLFSLSFSPSPTSLPASLLSQTNFLVVVCLIYHFAFLLLLLLLSKLPLPNALANSRSVSLCRLTSRIRRVVQGKQFCLFLTSCALIPFLFPLCVCLCVCRVACFAVFYSSQDTMRLFHFVCHYRNCCSPHGFPCCFSRLVCYLLQFLSLYILLKNLIDYLALYHEKNK